MRVTAAEVKEIMADVTLADGIVNSYILGANSMVNTVLAGKTLSDELLKEIERWLSAHLIAVTRERMASKEGAGGAFIEYAGNYGEGLKSTSYGQTVLVLDSTGSFAAVGRKQVQFTAIPGQL